jgi:micrococcal nuclease
MDLWNYQAVVKRVVDADTIDVDLDCGFRIYLNLRLRLARINAPEVYGVKKGSEEYQKGMEATEALEALMPVGSEIRVHTEKSGKYGRYIAEVYLDVEGEEVNISDHLVRIGHAVYHDY